MEAPATRPDRRPLGASAIYWGLVGAAASFGIAGILTVGIFVLAATAGLVALGAWLRLDTRGLPAIIIGAAFTPFYIAAINRSGPGWICTHTANSTSCSEQMNPWWFIAVGLALVAIGLILVLRRRTRPPVLTDNA